MICRLLKNEGKKIMELRLRVNDGKENAKVYTADTIDCSFGVVEDVLNVLDFDKISNKAELAAMILKSSKQLKPFLKDLFEGVTDEELRTVKMSNIVEVFKNLYNYALNELGSVGNSDEKN